MFDALHKVNMRACYAKQKISLACPYILLDLLLVRGNCAKFHYCKICVTDFRGGGLFAFSTREQSGKSPSWIGLMKCFWRPENEVPWPEKLRRISRNVASVNIPIHDVINLNYGHWKDKRKYSSHIKSNINLALSHQNILLRGPSHIIKSYH